MRLERTDETRFYLRVIRHGEVIIDHALRLLERPFAEW
jgi:MOSC domain-containing protein YiiM